MSFISDMASKAMGGSSNPIIAQITTMIEQQPGGLSGLVQQFHDKGLGGVVSSWVSTGQNLPISPDQIQNVLGSGMIEQLAAKFGVSPQEVSSHISQYLPQIIDKMTPQGHV